MTFVAPNLEFLMVCVASFAAGLVDAMVGGGGLIQLPALLIAFPGLPFAQISSVNKAASFAGTLSAAFRYARRVPPSPQRVVPGALVAFCTALLGAVVSTLVDSGFMRPLAIVLLAVVAIHTFVRKGWGTESRKGFLARFPRVASSSALSAVAIGIPCGLIGFYDGLFGPGTGTFFAFSLVFLFGLDFLTATSEAKVLNLATNSAAILALAWRGHFYVEMFLPLAACNVAGSLVGSQWALVKGAAFVRRVFLFIVVILLGKLLWDSTQLTLSRARSTPALHGAHGRYRAAPCVRQWSRV
ncbi:MAG: TSUP family transporter [Silvanigrellales bacterium]|jgi:uncharacterized membrane protein YfcA|nr:TSUP family transporter [Silvanigrellales bacterium]